MKRLRSRWQVLGSTAAVEPISARIIHGTAVKGITSPFGAFNGRKDFRYFEFTHGVKLVSCQLSEYDFSGVILKDAWIEGCVFFNCIFDDASLQNIADHGNVFDGWKKNLSLSAIGRIT